MMKIVVVGGGLAGLASAALLAHKGHKVILLEKNKDLGGRARVWKSKGFTFDLGPSWYTMPETWERYFGLLGRKVDDYLNLKRLDPVFSVYGEYPISNNQYPNNFQFYNYQITDDLKGQMAVFEGLEAGGGEKLRKHLQQARSRYDLAGEILYRHYGRIGLSDLGLAWRMRGAGILTTLEGDLRREFKSVTARNILSFSSVFLGGSPKNMAGLFSLMNWAVLGQGVYYPMGGMGKLVDALVLLCEKNNVTIKIEEEVTNLQSGYNAAISNVKTRKNTYECDAVVWAGDYHYCETKLLQNKLQTYGEKYWKKKIQSPSGYCLYLGIKGKLNNLQHHTMYFSDDWDSHFESVFDKKTWPKKPSVYISATTKSDKSTAPAGCENIFVLVPVASGIEDSQKSRSMVRDYVLNVLEKITGSEIRNKILVEREFSVSDFTNDYNSYSGSAFGLANTLFQTAWFRPRMVSHKVANLFYCGQNTQPGIGVPMCAISAELVSELI